MSNDEKPPKIDWAGQIRYFVLMLIGIMVVLALLRYFGLRG
jgi:hypothetical protein